MLSCFCFARNVRCFAKSSTERENITQYQRNKITRPSLGKHWTDSQNIHGFTANPVSSYWLYPPLMYPAKQGKSAWYSQNHGPCPSLMTEIGMLRLLETLAQECRPTYIVKGIGKSNCFPIFFSKWFTR